MEPDGKKKLKVLMLGWEFPPLLTGGLGPACYHIVKGLSPLVDVTLILPHTTEATLLERVQIIGLNHLDISNLPAFQEAVSTIVEKVIQEREVYSYETITKKVRYIKTDFDPYPVSSEYYREEEERIRKTELEKIEIDLHVPVPKWKEAAALMADTENYGPRIMEKVATYAEIVAEIASKESFDIIHAHDWITLPAAIALKAQTGKPLVVHIHSLETDRVVNPFARNKVYEIEQKGMQCADLVFSVSQYAKGCILQHYGLEEDKVLPILNGADQQRKPTNKKRKTKSPDEPHKVLFLGRVTKQKGNNYLVETAQKLLAFKPDTVFVVAGVGDQLRQTMMEVKHRGLSEHFNFLGYLDSAGVEDLLLEADVLFMPSVSEPFGLAAIEAAQYQLPLVISYQTGVAEVLQHALKADYWDTDAFANYLFAVLSYPGLADEMVHYTNQDIARLSWETTAAEIYAHYLQLYKP